MARCRGLFATFDDVDVGDDTDVDDHDDVDDDTHLLVSMSSGKM